MERKNCIIGTALVIALWAGFSLLAWFLPQKDISVAERRPLQQMPEISSQTLQSGSFMENFDA